MWRRYDFNGDGTHDLVAVRPSDNTLWLYGGLGNGTFRTAQQVGNGWGTTRQIVAGDFTSDGKGDLMAVRDDGSLWLYPGNGAGGFGMAHQRGHNWNNAVEVTGGGDYNNDGHADLVARFTDGALRVYFGDGAGAIYKAVQVGDGWSAFRTIV